MRQRVNKQLSVAVALLGLSYLPAAQSVEISFSAEALTGTDWLYHYTVTNDTLASDISEFTIYFDRTLYSNLAIAASPAGWDSLVVQPDNALPADGFFDSLAMIQGIPQGGTLSGFSVSFTYLGMATPGAQPFEIVDTNFNILEAGVTTPVPEPHAALLMLAGLGLVGLRGLFATRTNGT